MRGKAFLFAVSSVPLFAACSFLLDFNGLQGGHKATPDAGSDADTGDAAAGTGAASGAGNGGEAGAAGSSDAAACDGSDPRTVHACDPTRQSCTHTPAKAWA